MCISMGVQGGTAEQIGILKPWGIILPNPPWRMLANDEVIIGEIMRVHGLTFDVGEWQVEGRVTKIQDGHGYMTVEITDTFMNLGYKDAGEPWDRFTRARLVLSKLGGENLLFLKRKETPKGHPDYPLVVAKREEDLVNLFGEPSDWVLINLGNTLRPLTISLPYSR